MRTTALYAPLLGFGRGTSAMALLAQGRRVLVVDATELGRSSLWGSGQTTPLECWANRVIHPGQELRPSRNHAVGGHELVVHRLTQGEPADDLAWFAAQTVARGLATGLRGTDAEGQAARQAFTAASFTLAAVPCSDLYAFQVGKGYLPDTVRDRAVWVPRRAVRSPWGCGLVAYAAVDHASGPAERTGRADRRSGPGEDTPHKEQAPCRRTTMRRACGAYGRAGGPWCARP